MFNVQRTFISNKLLSFVGWTSSLVLSVCMSYSYKLSKELNTDMANPLEIYQKINSLKIPEYSSHLVLSIVMILKGNWIIGLMNFPFIFYDCVQLIEFSHTIEPNKLFSSLFNTIKIIKTKVLFFMTIILYQVWIWIIWVPPEYLQTGQGWKIVKPIQISN